MKKYYLLFFNYLSLIYLEIISAFILFKSINLSFILLILLFLLPFSIINTLLLTSFKAKTNHIIGIILYSLIGIWFSLQILFKNIFNVFFQVSLFALSDQVASFKLNTILLILKRFYFIILAFIPLILFVFLKNKLNMNKKTKYYYIITPIYAVILFLLFLFSINSFAKKTEVYKSIYKENNQSKSVKYLGIINSSILDIYKTVTNFEEQITIVSKEIDNKPEKKIVYKDNVEKIDFSKGNNTKINNYMINDIPTKQNEHTGIFKGKNLIYIVAESFHTIGVSKELTPTLYSLINDGYKFNNYYVPNNLSTIGGEFGDLTGLFADNSILKKWKSGKNYFPYGLGTKFKEYGYKTYAYHNNSYVFQNRNKYLKSQGFSNFKACFNGLEKLINCRTWPESDIQMIDKTVYDYIDNKNPFMVYYMTVSGHFEYTFDDNYIATKNKKYVKKLKYSQKVKGYVATQIELDKALQLLINRLKEKNKLDDTIIVLTADHYPYGLTEKEIAEISSYKRDSDVELHHNNLIIWNPNIKEEIDKPCMTIDVLPTIYNLFGITYDSRLLMGKDIFSNEEGIAFLKNRSWVTEKGTYYSSKKKFQPKTSQIDDNYVDRINKIVANRINISKMIVSNNYYKSIFQTK